MQGHLFISHAFTIELCASGDMKSFMYRERIIFSLLFLLLIFLYSLENGKGFYVTESDSASSSNQASRTPKDRSPKVIERRSPRSPVSDIL